MSISATNGSYMGHDAIDAWMEMKVVESSTEMGDAMDVSGHRSDAQQELNKIKAKLADVKKNGGQVDDTLFDEVDAAKKEYGDVPGVLDTLGAIKKPETEVTGSGSGENVSMVQGGDSATTVHRYQVDTKDIDNWTNAIVDTVSDLDKQDQFGLIHLNQLNTHINQAENLASALTDSRNKTLDAIINRIG